MNARIQPFALDDQAGQHHAVTFDSATSIILVIADRDGGSAAHDWGVRLAASTAQARSAEPRAVPIAALGGVPRLVRPFVRRSFASRPAILLDWDGAVARQLGFTGGCLVVRVERGGRVSARAQGPPSDSSWRTIAAGT